MSKLYYALSLWTDETRLHDPNLFLPALPAHYEPNLLAKIFSKQTDLWTQFVDLTQLNEKIESIVNKSGIQKWSSLRHSQSSGSSSSLLNRQLLNTAAQSAHFFKQEDRMVLLMPSLSQLGVKLKNAISEKYGSALEDLLRVETDQSSQNVNYGDRLVIELLWPLFVFYFARSYIKEV